MRKLPCLFALLLLVLSSSPALAQVSADQVPKGRVVPLKEGVETQMASSRWKLGSIRVDPTFSLGNLGYNDNVFGTEEGKVSDYTATVGLGIRAIAPLGSKTFLRLEGTPQYTWYKDLSERRRFGWTGRGEFLALFNRIQLQVGTSTSDTTTEVNSEDLTPTPVETFELRGDVEIEVFRRLSVFLGATQKDTTIDPDEADDPLNRTLLDRDELAKRVGVRYEFRPEITVFAMYELVTADFPNDATFSSNEADSVLLGFSYDRQRFYLNVVGGQKTLKYDTPGAPEFDEFTGSAYLTFGVFRRSELALSVTRSPVYSTFVENPFFFETRTEADLTIPMGHRFTLLAGLGKGKNDYRAPVGIDGQQVVRQDDFDSWKAGLGIRVFRNYRLDVEYSVDEYQSNIQGFDREIARVTVNLGLGI